VWEGDPKVMTSEFDPGTRMKQLWRKQVTSYGLGQGVVLGLRGLDLPTVGLGDETNFSSNIFAKATTHNRVLGS